jgi:hypothetical protein
MAVSTQEFLIVLAVGSALIAFWVVARFPDRGPGNFGRAIGHVVLAIAAGAFSPGIVAALATKGHTMALFAIFGIVLPVLVYTFLAAAWFLKLAHDMFARHH